MTGRSMARLGRIKEVEPVQMLTKRLSAVVLMACLLVALAFGGVAAWAADWYGVDNTLTVEPCGEDSEYASDLLSDDVEVTVDVYKIASAEPHSVDKAFDYVLDPEGPFAELSVPANPQDASDWDDLMNAAVAIVEGDSSITPTKSGLARTELGPFDDGLYLVMAREAHTDTHAYTFLPALVALPNKDGYRTDDPTDWNHTVTIVLKPERKPLYGDIEIKKTVQDFKGEGATFVYYLTGTTPDGDTYEDYAAVMCTSESGSTVVTHIPAGTEITVTEVDPGPRYEYVSGPEPATVTIDVHEVVSVSFVNKSNGSSTGGHGVQNNFEATEDGDWAWTPTAIQDDSETMK